MDEVCPLGQVSVVSSSESLNWSGVNRSVRFSYGTSGATSWVWPWLTSRTWACVLPVPAAAS